MRIDKITLGNKLLELKFLDKNNLETKSIEIIYKDHILE